MPVMIATVRPIVLALMLALSAAGTAAAIDVDLTPAQIDAALAIARGTEAERTAFHAPYIRAINEAVVERVELVSEFRRVVLIAEDRARKGDRMFGYSASQAQKALAPWNRRVSVIARLRFHPQNTYVSVPDYTAALIAPDGRRITSETLTRVARWTTRLDGPPAVPPPQTPAVPRGNTLLGATVVGRFDLEMLDPSGAYELVVGLSGEDLARRLARIGYSVSRQTGSHMRLTTTEPTQHHVTIPKHDALRDGASGKAAPRIRR